jgi:hypothetical protein
MADQVHLDILQQGVRAWNSWRERNPSIKADLSEADLHGVNLSRTDLARARLSGANLFTADLARADLLWADLTEANLRRANLSRAILSRADLSEANLSWANLSRANLRGANLARASLTGANLTEADLSDASLIHSNLAEANLQRTTLDGCRIYGISAWNLNLEGAKQQNLDISGWEEPAVTVDDLEVAQFVYLLIDNRKLRNVIQTMTSKAVLILGNFAPERRRVLDAIKKRLRDRDYLPILFDFEGPDSRDIVETVTTLARLARFIIADLTHSRSVPHELGVIIPDVEVPIVPLIEGSEKPVATFDALRRSHKHQVLELRRYRSSHDLLANFDKAILVPANERFVELENARKLKPQEIWMQADGDEER